MNQKDTIQRPADEVFMNADTGMKITEMQAVALVLTDIAAYGYEVARLGFLARPVRKTGWQLDWRTEPSHRVEVRINDLQTRAWLYDELKRRYPDSVEMPDHFLLIL